MFTFKQFCIRDTRSAMKVGTDGVILGAWACADGACEVIDAGSGSGLVSLMMAQRYPEIRITGIEIDPGACEDAKENAAASPWGDRITVLNADVLEMTGDTGRFIHPDGAICIVSNPPFFTETLQSPDSRRAAARHGTGFNALTLTGWASKVMRPGDVMSLIAPVTIDGDLQFAFSLHRLNVSRITDVVPSIGKEPIRRLYEVRCVAPGDTTAVVHDVITIRGADGTYTDGFRKLTCDFYLDR